MKHIISMSIFVIGSVLAGCSKSEPTKSPVQQAAYSSLGEELNKEVVMIRVDSLPETIPAMFYIDALGKPVNTAPPSNWYALVKESQQLIPVELLIPCGHQDLRESFTEFSEWIDDPNRDRLHHWSIIGQSASVEVGKFPYLGCRDCDIKVLMTGNKNWAINCGQLMMSEK